LLFVHNLAVTSTQDKAALADDAAQFSLKGADDETELIFLRHRSPRGAFDLGCAAGLVWHVPADHCAGGNWGGGRWIFIRGLR
jgi:hypothetical protein